MTFARRNHGAGHSYTLDGEKIPGVTTILNAMAKPALVDWAARTVAEAAVDDWDRWSKLAPSKRFQELSRAHRSSNKAAAARGTRIHALADKLQHEADVEVPDDLRGPVEAVARWLDLWQAETVWSETPVAHTAYRYGGTFDAVLDTPKLGRVLLDFKTGKGVFPETALQLAAYRYADVALVDGEEVDMLEVDRCVVAHVTSDDVETLPVDASEDTWRTFLYLAQVHRWTSVQGDRKTQDAIGQAVWPETA